MTIFQQIKHNFVLFSILACAFILSVSSCKKDMTSLIGGGLQPDNERICAIFDNSSEGLRLTAYTIRDIPSVTSAGSAFALGGFNDSTFFGTISVDLIAQIQELNPRDSVPPDFYRIDSAVLILLYLDAYPFDTNDLDPFRISIGELLEPELTDSLSGFRRYYSNDFRAQKNGGGTILSERLIRPNLRDSVPDPNDTSENPGMLHVPTLRIPLHADHDGVENSGGLEFAERLLRTSARHLPRSDPTKPSFFSEITGLYIHTHPEHIKPGRGNIVNFDFSGRTVVPHIAVYYRKTAEDTAPTRKIYSLGAWDMMTYNYIRIDSTAQASILRNQLDQTDTALGQEMVFVQSFFGSMFRVEIPDIRIWDSIVRKELDSIRGKPGTRIVINQASLVLSTSSNGRFTPASALNIGQLTVVDTVVHGTPRQEWRTQQIRDHQVFVGGGYRPNREEPDRGEYRIILTRHIQNLLSNPEAENFPLTIFPNNRFIPGITSIYGPSFDNDDRRMRLEIVYSVLPDE